MASTICVWEYKMHVNKKAEKFQGRKLNFMYKTHLILEQRNEPKLVYVIIRKHYVHYENMSMARK